MVQTGWIFVALVSFGGLISGFVIDDQVPTNNYDLVFIL
jgi:hypothetical protein